MKIPSRFVTKIFVSILNQNLSRWIIQEGCELVEFYSCLYFVWNISLFSYRNSHNTIRAKHVFFSFSYCKPAQAWWTHSLFFILIENRTVWYTKTKENRYYNIIVSFFCDFLFFMIRLFLWDVFLLMVIIFFMNRVFVLKVHFLLLLYE